MNNTLTPAQQELLNAIIAHVGEDGYARSLFRVGVVVAGQDYRDAWNRLHALELARLVRVRRRRGRPLAMRPLVE